MGRITGINEIKAAVDKYASSTADYFSLKDDGAQARVRFNHGDDKDLDIYVVHKVKLPTGKDKYIECHGSDGKPCELCKAGLKPQVRIFLTLKDQRDGKLKIWDRGKTEIATILGLITRYGKLDSREFDVERHGKKGDTQTTYQFFPCDPSTSDLKPREDICGVGKFIDTKTTEELKVLLQEIDVSGDSTTSYKQQTGGTARERMF